MVERNLVSVLFMRIDFYRSLLAIAFAVASFAPAVVAADKEPLVIKFPIHTPKGTPEDLPAGSTVEPLSDKPPKPLEVPKGVVNVAKDKPVTASVEPYLGELKQITDGDREPFDEQAVEFKKGLQWVQVDLGKSHEIHAVLMWHDHRYIQAFRDVILQVSEDPEFKNGVTTLYNNDADNSAGFGVGTDREYFELEFGRAVPAKGVKARYVRGYTRGSSLSAANGWQEIEVYALSAK
jgi:hypothetical protein